MDVFSNSNDQFAIVRRLFLRGMGAEEIHRITGLPRKEVRAYYDRLQRETQTERRRKAP